MFVCSRRAFLFNFATVLSPGILADPAYAARVPSTLRGATPTMITSDRKLLIRTVADVSEHAKVLPGIDVLAAGGFADLVGQRVGLVTNQSGSNAAGQRTIDVLRNAPGERLVEILSPEHGINGDREGKIESGHDVQTGLPIYSLYGDSRRPTAKMLSHIDALVIDLQDVGARFYTYITTMGYLMEEAGPRSIKVVVLDRPNPIGPAGARGPVLDADLHSFTGYFPMPTQHGMTIGELANMFNVENRINAELTVVSMRFYRRNLWYDETGLSWINPSPNLRSVEEAILYPGVALIEGTNISVGRGTPSPFELVGAPWIDSRALTSHLEERKISGVRFEPANFTPNEDRYAQESCRGVRIALVDRAALDAPRLGIELAAALRWLYSDRFTIRGMLGSLGSRKTLAAIERGEDPLAIMEHWQPELRDFESIRTKYLLYS
jgi:uncharacterized protein YbbC (DUF1343 family)